MTAKARVTEEFKVIPAWAYVNAAIVFILTAGFLYRSIWAGQGYAPLPFRIFMTFFPPTFLAVLALMVGYVNADAGRRRMSRTLWTIIVIIVPNAIGFILYFLLRSPIQTDCPKCGTAVQSRDNFCPTCGYSFNPTCPKCRSAVRSNAKFCANCGTDLSFLEDSTSKA
jgi:hypothetical protein